MDLATVSARVGHSNVRVTAEIYAHVIRGRDDEAAQRWEDFQRQNLPEKRAGDIEPGVCRLGSVQLELSNRVFGALGLATGAFRAVRRAALAQVHGARASSLP